IRRLGWRDARPWAEFTAEFKAPRAWARATLEPRVLTNLLYYRGNYALITVACIAAAVATTPQLFLAGAVAAGAVAVLLPQDGGDDLIIAGRHFDNNERMFLLAAALLVAVSWVRTQLLRLFCAAAVGVAISLGHAALRPRNIRSRANRAAEEAKL
ncbi:unnamed protein product, partial [Phaeothamnion confervicola]